MLWCSVLHFTFKPSADIRRSIVTKTKSKRFLLVWNWREFSSCFCAPDRQLLHHRDGRRRRRYRRRAVLPRHFARWEFYCAGMLPSGPLLLAVIKFSVFKAPHVSFLFVATVFDFIDKSLCRHISITAQIVGSGRHFKFETASYSERHLDGEFASKCFCSTRFDLCWTI